MITFRFGNKELVYSDCASQLLRVLNYAHDCGGKKVIIINNTKFSEEDLLNKIKDEIPTREKERTLSRLETLLFSPMLLNTSGNVVENVSETLEPQLDDTHKRKRQNEHDIENIETELENKRRKMYTASKQSSEEKPIEFSKVLSFSEVHKRKRQDERGSKGIEAIEFKGSKRAKIGKKMSILDVD